eukprot:SAG31_NODE_2470_length_5649_cov_2.713694_3_plen_174_part_00
MALACIHLFSLSPSNNTLYRSCPLRLYLQACLMGMSHISFARELQQPTGAHLCEHMHRASIAASRWRCLQLSCALCQARTLFVTKCWTWLPDETSGGCALLPVMWKFNSEPASCMTCIRMRYVYLVGSKYTYYLLGVHRYYIYRSERHEESTANTPLCRPEHARPMQSSGRPP